MSPTVKAQHSSASCDWGTPADIIEMAHDVLGGIDVDPASSAKHNERVQALYYLDGSPGRDGLINDWRGPTGHRVVKSPYTVFLNPPGDKTGQMVKQFWQRLTETWKRDECSAIWIGFSLEQLVSLQSFKHHPLHGDFVCAVPNKRIRFVGGGDAPTHGNYICLLPQSGEENARFEAWCEKLGWACV